MAFCHIFLNMYLLFGWYGDTSFFSVWNFIMWRDEMILLNMEKYNTKYKGVHKIQQDITIWNTVIWYETTMK